MESGESVLFPNSCSNWLSVSKTANCPWLRMPTLLHSLGTSSMRFVATTTVLPIARSSLSSSIISICPRASSGASGSSSSHTAGSCRKVFASRSRCFSPVDSAPIFTSRRGPMSIRVSTASIAAARSPRSMRYAAAKKSRYSIADNSGYPSNATGTYPMSGRTCFRLLKAS